MKQRLFENVGGNKFVLNEGVTNKAELIRSGIKKVFGAGHKKISYNMLENVGLGYINDVTEAKKTALQEARAMAKECGYVEDENTAKFVKEDGEMSDYDRDKYENTPRHSESDMDNPEEKREVQIANEVIKNIDVEISTREEYGEPYPTEVFDRIKALMEELIQMHGQK